MDAQSSESEVISLVKAAIAESKGTVFREHEKGIIQYFQDQFVDLPSIHNQHPDDFANGITSHIGGTFDRDHAIKLLDALKGKIDEITNGEVVSLPDSTVEMNIITEPHKTDDSKTDTQLVRIVTHTKSPSVQINEAISPTALTIDDVTDREEEEKYNKPHEKKKEEHNPMIAAVKKAIEKLKKEKPKKAPLLNEYGDKIIDYFRTSGIDKERLFKMSNKELGVSLAEYCDGNKKVKGLAGALLKNMKAQIAQMLLYTEIKEVTRIAIQALDSLETEEPESRTYRDMIIEYIRKKEINKLKLMRMPVKDWAKSLTEFCKIDEDEVLARDTFNRIIGSLRRFVSGSVWFYLL